jgi:MFS family permease
MADADERTRLLPDQPDQDLERVPVTISPRPEINAAFPRRHLFYCILIFFTSFLVTSSSFLQVIPLYELLSRAICHHLHPEYDPDGPECFIDGQIGEELVLVTQLSYVFTFLPGILTAIPYGFLADQYGRKFGLFLAIVGLVLGQAFNIIICEYSCSANRARKAFAVIAIISCDYLT